MGKASRSKRSRGAVRSAKRARNNTWWYGLTAIVVIAGVSLIVYSRATAPAEVGPYVADQNNPSNPHNRDSHWHTDLGVYDCDHWVGDEGNGAWAWPTKTVDQPLGRADNPSVYAGMHSHDDGIIHMEPAVNEEAGRHATIGKYFEYGGWKISSTGYDFDHTKVQNGDKCGSTPGSLQWEVASFNGKTSGKQSYTVKSGDPSSYKLHDNDIVVIAFLPNGKNIADIGNPPSLVNLPDAKVRGEQSHASQTTPSAPASTVPTGSTPTSAASSPTSGAPGSTAKKP